jgi:membrane protein DedA with SNARE-associated domain
MTMASWITDWLESLGYFGVFALMVLEHVFPPIPSELVMPLSGFISHRSAEMSLGWVIVAGSIGSLVGTFFWYYLGRQVDKAQLMILTAKYGKWLTLKPKDIEKAIAFFQRGGGNWVVGFGRVVPGVRTYVSVPAGLTKMPLLPYLIYSAIGTILWTAALAIAGYILGNQFEQVSAFIAPVSKGVLVALVLGTIGWVIYRRRHHRSKP